MARMEQGQLAVCETSCPHINLQGVRILASHALGTLIEESPAVSSAQRARNEAECCMFGLLARLNSVLVWTTDCTSQQGRPTLLEIQFAMRGRLGPCRSRSAWLMKTVASLKVLTGSRGNKPEAGASAPLHIKFPVPRSSSWVALPVAIYSLPFPVRTAASWG